MSEEQLAFDYGPEERIQQVLFMAEKKYREHKSTSGTSFYVIEQPKFKAGQKVGVKLWYAMRTFIYDTDWDYFFEVQPDEAEAIVKAGFASRRGY